MKELLVKIDDAIEPLRGIADQYASPLFDLSIRLYMAQIFFNAGMIKLNKIMNGDWAGVVEAFTDYYPVPGVPPELAAIGGTVGELTLPILLAFGLFARFGAAGLFMMTVVIQFLVPAEYGIQNPQHYFWMFLLGAVFIKGAGPISLDWLLVKWIRK